MRLGESLASIVNQIIPTPAEMQLLRSRVDQVVAATGHFAGIAERHPAGSFAKGTMLRGRKEADVVAVLAQAPTDRTLADLADHLQRELKVQVYTTYKAVRIVFDDGASIDLLPVARAGTTAPGPSIPRKLRHALSGIQHVAWAKREIHGSPRHDTVRLLKRLRDQNSDLMPLSSFTVEVLCAKAVPSATRGIEEALQLALAGIAETVSTAARLADPADFNNDLLADVARAERDAIARRAHRLLTDLQVSRPETIFGVGGR